MRSFVSTSLTMLLLLPACGDDDDGGTETGTTAPVTTTTGEGTTETTTTGTTEITDTGTTVAPTGTETGTTEATGIDTTADTTAGTEGTTATTGETGETTGGMAALEATMSDLQIAQDCMPVVEPDPVALTLTLELTNNGEAPASASVAEAAFYDAGGMEVATIDVMPAEFGPIPVGDSTTEVVTKVAGSLMPAGSCDVLSCDQSYTFELVLSVGGDEVKASESATVSCVF